MNQAGSRIPAPLHWPWKNIWTSKNLWAEKSAVSKKFNLKSWRIQSKEIKLMQSAVWKMSKTIMFTAGKAQSSSILTSVPKKNKLRTSIQASKSWSTIQVEEFQRLSTTSAVTTWKIQTLLLDLNSMRLRSLTTTFFNKFHFCILTINRVRKIKARFHCRSETQMDLNLRGFQTVLLKGSVWMKFHKSWTFL